MHPGLFPFKINYETKDALENLQNYKQNKVMPFSEWDILFIDISFILFVCEIGVFAVRE